MNRWQTASRYELKIFGASLFLIIYFGLLFLNGYLIKLDYTIINVLQEILTIPFMALSLVLLYFSGGIFITRHYPVKSYAFYSTVFLTVLIIITWVSFFI